MSTAKEHNEKFMEPYIKELADTVKAQLECISQHIEWEVEYRLENLNWQLIANGRIRCLSITVPGRTYDDGYMLSKRFLNPEQALAQMPLDMFNDFTDRLPELFTDQDEMNNYLNEMWGDDAN